MRNKERGRPPNKFADSELQALLDEDDAQTQQQLADQLNVTREAVSIRLKALGKIQNVGKWVPHALTTAGKSKNRLRNSARQVQKEIISRSNCDW